MAQSETLGRGGLLLYSIRIVTIWSMTCLLMVLD